MNLADLRTLGHSGLPVSPLCLGTMTFGNKAWGSNDETSRKVFNAYVDAGGNFVDTADVYSGGRSEELLGSFIGESKLRDGIVLATKWSFRGGNGRKNFHRALEASLRRLGTDYIDLYWMHVWDGVTPPEEMLESFNNLVRSGKTCYFGLSDVPAWYVARMATLAQVHGVPGPIALQLPYSLTERTIEHEHVPAARELGLGITPWSPLDAGFLSGKYARDQSGHAKTGDGRLDLENQPFRKFTERNWAILQVLLGVSREAGYSPAQVALAWALAQPGITSLILGATSPEQLGESLASLQVTLSTEHLGTLTQAGVFEPSNFYSLFENSIRRSIFGGASVRGWPE